MKGRPPKLPPEKQAKVRQEFWRGRVNTIERIAARHGISRNTVVRYATRSP
jgi:hypothetical protein